MKRIVLISTFCNTEEKLKMLKSKLIELKSMGIDSMILTQFELPFSVIELATYCFITRDNPIIKWPEFSRLARKQVFENGKAFLLVKGISDYGFAHASQYKTLSKIALSYDYEVFYFMNYDLLVDETVVKALSANDISCNLWPCQRGDFSARATLNFMAFNRENLIKLIESIRREQYVSNLLANPSDATEHWIDRLCTDTLAPVFEESPVTDLVCNYSGIDHHNYSKIESAKIFIQKCNLERFSVDLIVYEYAGEKTISVKTNLGEEEYTGLSPAIFTLSKDTDELLTTVVIDIDGESQELINDIRGVDINQIVLY